jgi:hypothetical protein
MKEKDFDALLKNSLDHIEPSYDPGSWALLQKRLDLAGPPADNLPDQAFDARIGQVLERLETPYQPAHWQLLADRMVAERRLRRRVWITKIAEAAIFLLLLAQLDGLLCGTSGPREARPWNGEPVAESPVAAPRNQSRSAVPSTDASASGRKADGAGWITDATDAAGDKPAHSGLALLADVAADGGTPPASTGRLLSAEHLHSAASGTSRSWEPWADLAGLPVDLASADQSHREAPQLRLQPGLVNRAPRSRPFYAGVYGAAHRQVVRAGDDRRPVDGYGGGLIAGYRRGPWGVETGLGYSRQRYEPKRQVEIYDGNLFTGYYGSTIATVDADVLDVPVRAMRRLAGKNRTQLHATAGATAHVALQKDYRYKTAFFPGSSQGPPTAPAAAPQLRRQGQGVLEGGSVNDGNFYVSAHAGLRLEQSVGRLTAFVQPEYRQAVAGLGIGPKRNKISGFTVQAGVVASL